MDHADAHRLLRSDPRIAARIVEILGRRLVAMEQRLCEAVFNSVPQRVAAALCALVAEQPATGPDGLINVTVTHSQLAALAGTSRETTTEVLGRFAGLGLLRPRRGRISSLDRARLAARAVAA